MCNCRKYTASINTYDEIVERCNHSTEIAESLILKAKDIEQWLELLVCEECGTFWGKGYPFSGHHGGGLPCLFQVPNNSKLQSVSPKFDEIIIKYENEEFYKILDEEVGPENCNQTECNRLHIKNSKYCKLHHYEMIIGETHVN